MKRMMQRQQTVRAGLVAIASMLVLSLASPVRAGSVVRDPGCTAATLQGSYAYSRTGIFIAEGPAAANGVVIFDGQGNLAGADTSSVNGVITQRAFKGAYDVEADCTGTAKFELTDGELVTLALQIVSARGEVQFIQTDAGTVVTGSARQMTVPFLAKGDMRQAFALQLGPENYICIDSNGNIVEGATPSTPGVTCRPVNPIPPRPVIPINPKTKYPDGAAMCAGINDALQYLQCVDYYNNPNNR
jgi:hypothetical protein